ncbi:MAG: hypothetical protein ACR2MK_05430 [Solirubrobacteraceae bacterium]
MALDRELAVDRERLTIGAYIAGAKIDRRMVLDVEELRPLDVRGEVLVLDCERADGAVPVRARVPSSPTVRVASYSSKRPRNVETIMCLTAKPAVE